MDFFFSESEGENYYVLFAKANNFVRWMKMSNDLVMTRNKRMEFDDFRRSWTILEVRWVGRYVLGGKFSMKWWLQRLKAKRWAWLCYVFIHNFWHQLYEHSFVYSLTLQMLYVRSTITGCLPSRPSLESVALKMH